jgi:hypothetical protein
VLYDYSYQTKNGQPHKKIIFVFWWVNFIFEILNWKFRHTYRHTIKYGHNNTSGFLGCVFWSVSLIYFNMYPCVYIFFIRTLMNKKYIF